MSNSANPGGVREGEVLAGKYRIDKVLGMGGMGVVVAAHHIHLDERVAIKFLLPEALGNQEAVTRFAREARAAVKIKSEHVVRVSDVGTLDTGAPYMVMEYLEGGDLAGWLKQRGALPVEQAAEFVLQACEAIAEAHALGMVHRDLKPANLFVIRRPDGTLSVKVLDFGISKVTRLGSSDADASMTKTSALMGSPLYMSPEQMQSAKNVDARSDIWALGIILYEIIAGDVPFVGETMPELVVSVLQAPPQPMRDKRPDLPDGIEAVIVKCLDKDRGRRYQTVGELAMALLPFAPKSGRASLARISGVMRGAGLSSSALALPPSSDELTPPGGKAATAAAWGQTAAGPKGGRTALGVAAAVLLAVGAVSAIMMSRKPSAEEGVASEGTGAAAAAPPPVVAPAEPASRPEEATPAASPASAAPSASAAPLASATPPAGAARPRPGSAVLRPATVSAAAAAAAMKPGVAPAPAPAPAAEKPPPAASAPKRRPVNAYDDRN